MKLGVQLCIVLLLITLCGAAVAYTSALKISAPTGAAAAGTAVVTGKNVAFSFLALIIALCVALSMGYSATHHLRQLTHNIESISKGRLDIHIDGQNRPDEIGELARAFDRILTSLKLAVEKVGIRKEELKLGEALEAKESAERERHEAEERYRVLAQTSPDCIKLIDKFGKIIFMNQTGLSEHGFKNVNDVIGKDVTTLAFKKEFHGKVKTALKDAITGKTTTLEVQHQSQNEHEWFLATFSPVKNDQGEVTSVLAISRNITPLKQTTLELKSEKEFVQEIIEHAGVPVLAYSKHGELLIANPILLDLTGYDKKDITTQKQWIANAIPWKEAQDKLLHALAQIYQGKKINDFVIPLQRKDKSTIIVVSNITSIRSPRGEIIGACAFMRDLSEIFNLENQIRSWATETTLEQPPRESSIERSPQKKALNTRRGKKRQKR